MRKFLTYIKFYILLMGSSLTASASFNAVYDWKDFQLDVVSISNRPVKITPLSTPFVSGSSVVLGVPKYYTNDSTGQFTVTNMLAGAYRVDLSLLYGYSIVITNNFPTNTSGTVSFVNYIAAGTNQGVFLAWSTAASDARYVPFTNLNNVLILLGAMRMDSRTNYFRQSFPSFGGVANFGFYTASNIARLNDFYGDWASWGDLNDTNDTKRIVRLGEFLVLSNKMQTNVSLPANIAITTNINTFTENNQFLSGISFDIDDFVTIKNVGQVLHLPGVAGAHFASGAGVQYIQDLNSNRVDFADVTNSNPERVARLQDIPSLSGYAQLDAGIQVFNGANYFYGGMNSYADGSPPTTGIAIETMAGKRILHGADGSQLIWDAAQQWTNNTQIASVGQMKAITNAQDIAITGTNAITLKAGTNSFVVNTNSSANLFEVWHGNNKRIYGQNSGVLWATTGFAVPSYIGGYLTVNGLQYPAVANSVFSATLNGPIINRTINNDLYPLLKIQHGNDTDGKNYEFRWDDTNTVFALNQTGTEAVAPADWRLENRINGISTNSIRIGSGANILELFNGTTKKVNIYNSGIIDATYYTSANGLYYGAPGTSSGATLFLGSSGATMTRNTAGQTNAFVVNQQHAGSTNGIAEFQAQGYGKIQMTVDGGFAIRLTNNTGATSIKGTVVSACTNSPECVMLTPANWANPIGIIAESGVGTNQPVWVVTSGRALVLLKDGTSATNGNWVYMSDTAGRAAANIGLYPDLTSLGGVQQHALEIGHSLGSFTNASSTLIPVNIHFQ